MNKIYKCFISSTFRDLEEERRRVIEAILDARQLPAGMENFNASDKSQWDYIKQMLADTDYFIVIVAHRYGSTDEGGMSYTEKEVRHALDLGIPVLSFIINESAEWPHSGYEDDTDKKVRLAQFKKYLSTDKLVKYWDNKDDLAAKVTAALHQAIKDNPRPGYIRCGATGAENETATSGRKPEFRIEFDGKPELKIDLDTMARVDPVPFLPRVEKIGYGQPAKLNVSDRQVEEWNMLVSDRNREISEYNILAEEYNNQWEPVRMKFSVSNLGTQRANNISIVMEFPDWIEVYDKEKQTEKPELPDIPENPVRAAMNRQKARAGFLSVAQAFAVPRHHGSWLEKHDLSVLLGDGLKRFLTIKSEHVAVYHADTLQHGSTLTCDKLRLLPLERNKKSGIIRIICHCDEIPEPQIVEIPVMAYWSCME